MKRDLFADAAELARLRESTRLVKSEVLPVVDGLVNLIEGRMRDCGRRKRDELTGYIHPLRAVRYILQKRVD